jgi:hypothetical protein
MIFGKWDERRSETRSVTIPVPEPKRSIAAEQPAESDIKLS